MIDWVSFVAPCRHTKRIQGGLIASLRADGQHEWVKIKRLTIRGSWDTSIQIRSSLDGDGRSFIEVSGNPVKWFQGHNLWGTDDLPALVVSLLNDLASRIQLGLSPSEADRAQWSAGAVKLTRVDVTDSFHLRNRADVLAWLRAAEQTAYLSRRGRGELCKGSTLYFGKHSRRWSLKLYSKGQEIESVGHGQDAILGLPSARTWADRALRAELVLRSMELQRLGLSELSAWHQDDGVYSAVTAMLHERMGALTMTTTTKLDDGVLATLTSAQRTGYLAWAAGNDLRATMSRAAFYKLRSRLLPHGLDIATVVEREKSNVIPLVRILEAKPAGIPDWAEGTPLYFEPRARRIA